MLLTRRKLRRGCAKTPEISAAPTTNFAQNMSTSTRANKAAQHLRSDKDANSATDIGNDDDDTELLDQGTDTANATRPPALAHHLRIDSSILTLAVGDEYIYAGTQDGEIVVWSLASFEVIQRIQAHTRSVLCLVLSPDRSRLFSSAGDAIVNVWEPKTLKRLYHIYSTYDVGDVFSVAYSAQFETVYLGAQNTSIQWCSLKDVGDRPAPNSERHPDKRNHRFFDSVAKGGKALPRPPPVRAGADEGDILEIDQTHMRQYAHFGYIYCMSMARGVSRMIDSGEDVLISGGGDGTIKLWKLCDVLEVGIEEVTCLGEDDGESVLSIAVDGLFLYDSKLDGIIEVWDLDTRQKVRVVQAHKGDIMTVQMGWGYLWSGGATGLAKVGRRFSQPDIG